VTHASQVFDGAASFDEITFPTKGFSGLTLRLYNPESGNWSLYWASKRTGTLFPPVAGRFTGGRGEFYGDDAYEGKDVRARFIWSDITPSSAHWEQAFSLDDGLDAPGMNEPPGGDPPGGSETTYRPSSASNSPSSRRSFTVSR